MLEQAVHTHHTDNPNKPEDPQFLTAGTIAMVSVHSRASMPEGQ